MKTDSTNNSYKVISLFLKAVIFIASAVYIAYKLCQANVSSFFLENKINAGLLIVAFLLLFANWGLESYKWKLLVDKIERLTFLKAFQSVLSGISIGIFTPNRIGEFAGRVFFLEYENKIRATLIYFIGSFFQLLVTIVAGVISAVFFVSTNENIKIELLQIFSNRYVLLLFTALVLALAIVFFLRKKIKEKYSQYIDVFYLYSKPEFIKLLFYSLLRYVVFAFQYFLVLKAFGVELSFLLSITLIALTFFVSSIIPTFALTEMSVRGASAIYFFGFYIEDTSSVLAASLLLWLINLAIPAAMGYLYIWRLNFFKE